MQNNFFGQKPEFVTSQTQDVVRAFRLQIRAYFHLKLHQFNP